MNYKKTDCDILQPGRESFAHAASLGISSCSAMCRNYKDGRASTWSHDMKEHGLYEIKKSKIMISGLGLTYLEYT
jgi:hypothetical protein